MATTASQPISLGRRNARNPQDVHMASGSYTSGEGDSFNPASYTRHFLGSPMSFRSAAGSYNGRLLGYPGSVGSVTMGSPIDMHRDPAVSNALKIFEFQDELCRNYTCCGVHLTDLHALLEHFEDVHVVCIDQPGAGGPRTRISVPFEPQIIDAGGVPLPIPSNQPQNQQQSQSHQMHQGGGPVDPDDMELEILPPSSNASASSSIPSSPTSTPSPPETILATPLSTYASPNSLVHSSLAAAYPGGYPGVNTQKSISSLTAAHTDQTSQNSDDLQSSHRPNLALNLSGFSSSAARPALHSPFITGPPPGASWTGHGTPGGVDMTYMGNIGMNGGLAMGGYTGNFDYQNPYGYNFSQAQSNDAAASDGAVDMGCVQPALLFSSPSSPQSHKGEGDDEDLDAEFDIDIEEQEIPQSTAGDTLKKEKISAATKSTSSKISSTRGKGDVPSAEVGSTNVSSAVSSNVPSGSSSGTATKPSPRIGRPPTSGGSSLLQSKPFKCPKPNCNKSYKQANGLKYHITHGSCNFAPPKDLEHVQAILERKRKQQQQQQQDDTQSPLSAASSGANTPRSGMATPITPSSLQSPFGQNLTVNTGITSLGSSSGSAVNSPVASSPGSHFTGTSFTPAQSSLSSALSSALSLSSPTSKTPGYPENTFKDAENPAISHPSTYNSTTSSSSSSSSLINALVPISTSSNSSASATSNSNGTPNTATSLTSLRSTLSSLPPSELLAIEAEAERQLKPYACGVGDCPRRYKNMNGLRYHYQHSGDHGATGLQWLASGKHECLAQRGDKGVGKSKGFGAVTGPVGSSAYPSGGRVGGAEREGRKVRGAGGSSSKPPSRASSVSASRTGTPVNTSFPLLPYSTQGAQGEVSAVPAVSQAYQSTPPYSSPSSRVSSPQMQTSTVQYQQSQPFSPQPTNATHPAFHSHLAFPGPGV
ncbi:hypothetical protein D9757_012552 [Collybiopsis confluens]|uniref:C2H2-type domain-containing protein n=1 Tax=Collybiopsis confluens TaxID=2823264 RepID=A0A8H5D8V7_9AGAR|nr:hypothetical protein D9757_012552 [Collybiopsis confluens]